MKLTCILFFILFPMSHALAQSLVFPLQGEPSSSFGKRAHPIVHKLMDHLGTDIPAPVGTHIRAIAKGQIIFAAPFGGYGNLIVLLHANRVSSHYAHCSEIYATVGQTVQAGEIIGAVGRSGLATGPHLHLEIRAAGVAKDPSEYLPGLMEIAKG